MPSDKPRKRPRDASADVDISAALNEGSAFAAGSEDDSDGADDRFELAGDGFSDDGGAEDLLADDAGPDMGDEAAAHPDQLSTEALLEYKAKADRTGRVGPSARATDLAASSTSRASRPAWDLPKSGISCRSMASSVACSSSTTSAVR